MAIIVNVLLQAQGIADLTKKITTLANAVLEYENQYLLDTRRLNIQGRLKILESILTLFQEPDAHYKQDHPINVILENMTTSLVEIHKEMNNLSVKIKDHSLKYFYYLRTLDISLHETNIEQLLTTTERHLELLLRILALPKLSTTVNDYDNEDNSNALL